MADASADAPVCPRHPNTVAYVRCQRCERPTCPACQRPAAVGVMCVDCVNQARAQQRPMKSRLGFVAAQGAPLVTYAIIALNVVFFAYGIATGERSWQVTWGMVPAFTDAEPWRVLTSAFVHGSFFHIGINMFVLWQFGSTMEVALGRFRYAGLYVGSALGGSAAIQFLAPERSLHVGASGAVFGLIAAYAIVLKTLNLPYQQVAFLGGAWLVAGYFIGQISWQGHLGGAIAGAALMLIMLRRVQRRQGAAPAPK